MIAPRKFSGFPSLLLLLAALPYLLDAQTTVTLVTSPNPSALGVTVVLTATVTPSTATGRVTFYDGVTMLGVKPLVSGAASFSTIGLPAGSHKLKAYYGGDGANAAASSTVIPQTVTAFPSSGFAVRPLATPATSILAVADFNGDGKADLVIRTPAGAAAVLLGDGTGNFQASSTYSATGFTPAAAAVGDFNGDGFADLALANSAGNSVIILLGNGDGTFQAPLSSAVPNALLSLAVGDFNGDGKADIVTADPVSGVNILLGKGDGTFQPAVNYKTQAGASVPQAVFVLVGDFNGDGKADLATANSSSATLSILLGKGDGTFQAAATVAIPSPAVELAVADFNGDGAQDLATNNADVLLGKPDGTGTFKNSVNYAAGSTPSSVAVGDFNGDGKIDLVLSDGVAAVLLGKGDGTFQPLVNYATGAGASVVVGEFNGDGKTDLVLANGSSMSLLLGTTVTVVATGGTPQSAAVRTPFPTPLQVTVMNGASTVGGVTVAFTAPSGLPTDLAPSGLPTATLSSGTAVTDAINGNASVTATANGVPGSYTVTATALGVSTSFSLTNLAGAATVITASPALPQSTPLGTAFTKPLQVTITDSTGLAASGLTVTFTAPASGASAVLSAGTAVTNASGVASVTATANNIPGSYTVTASAGALSAIFSLTNLQATTVTLATSPNASLYGAAVTLTATVTNSTSTGRVTFFDGVTVLGTKPVSSGTASLSTILLPAGSRKLTAYYRDAANAVAGTSNVVAQTVQTVAGGAFITQVPLSLRPAVPLATVGDFNGDGKVDFAFAAFVNGSAAVTVLLGKGDGTFQPPVSYPLGAGGPAFIAAGDFNGDGNTDLAVSVFIPAAGSQGIATVSVLLGNGDGTFGPAVSYAAGSSLALGPLAIGDFNGDGKADLVNSSGVAVNILLGNGDGTFGAPIAYSALGGPFVVADFNGDGKPDLALANTSILGVSSPVILLGNGDGTAQTPVGFSLGVNASIAYLVSGDFNGDGKADLAVGGFVTGTGAPTTWILLGNGNGTFQPAVSYSLGAAVTSGDFNGDGFTDLVVTDSSGNTVGILQGKGDGTFQPGPALAAGAPLAVADFNGDGKPDILTANSANGTITVLLGATSVSFSLTATGGASQSAATGTQFAVPLQVTVLNNGIPLSGATVAFTAPSSGASAALSSPTAATNVSGVASVTATANFVAGGYVVTATYQGLTATFSLSNTIYAFITATGGTPQSSALGAGFANALQATVKDALGNPVSGVTVNFTAPASGASAVLSSPTALTNVSGVASVTATANNISGAYIVTASAGSLSTPFSLTNLTGSPASLAATGGTPQLAVVGTAFAVPLQATVKDAFGNLVSGATVTFTAPGSGASAVLSSPTAVTNASGVASVAAIANNIVGSYTVTATLGTLLSASFSLSNAVSLSASITATGGTPQFAALGTAFSSALQVTAKDPSGNLLSGITVTFTAPASGAGALLSSTTAMTNASGVASVTATANNTAGSYIVTATYGNLSALFFLSNLAGGNSNLALGQAATQSSTLAGYPTDVAQSAVDGNTDGNFFDGSVTATNFDTNAWWQVDLGAPATVNSIVIWNRTDACCVSRLADYWVFVSNTPFLPTDTPTTLQNRSGTFSSHQTAPPTPSTTIAVGAPGRYVRVQLTGTNYLSLAEVQVLGTAASTSPNLALGKQATQSSTYPGYVSAVAASAVDGNTDGYFSDGSVTATNLDTNAWWQVDLGSSAIVNSIVIFNRTDCCGDRLSDYWVFVSNTPFLATDTPTTLQNRAGTFSSHQTTAPNPSTTIAAGGAQGQYVRVQLTGTNYLSLAEVQVFGTGAPAISDLAVGKPVAQSSTYPGYASAVAASAADGNTDGNFSDSSVTSTNLDTNAWWQVDLGSSATISSIVVWNRTDCCSDRLTDYWVFVSNTPFLATDTPATLQSRAGTFNSHQTTAPNPSTTIAAGGLQGRYIRVQLTGTNYLSLAEVQVLGTLFGTNLALGKAATQDSNLAGYPTDVAQSAVDGNTDGNFFDGSVTATNSDTNAWWQVDLGVSAAINSIVVWNRTDACCVSRLSDYWVFVSNTPFLATDTPATLQGRAGTFSSHQTTAPTPSTTIAAGGLQGRYIRVQLTGTGYLSLAEVQVFGQ